MIDNELQPETPDKAGSPTYAEQSTALQCYEIALRNSNVTVFTQDRDLRYRSISNPFLGLKIEEIVGRTDDEIIPAETSRGFVAFKREALEAGVPRDGEVQLRDGQLMGWFDLHVEPLRGSGGEVVGITCAAVDITERKDYEEHLRLVMRELTHRSKNLLALVQALARQTARYTRSIDGFIDHFGARLQALARSHDLIVQEGWQSVGLEDLVRSQLGACLTQNEGQISITGPRLRLVPDAAQNLGLALHELVINAARFGALSAPDGKLAVSWSRSAQEDVVDFVWSEAGGPTVGVPRRRGFGSIAIETHLARSLEAAVSLKFRALAT
jgi:PAS domain S-box-containing protein